jgi:hypothetical protein
MHRRHQKIKEPDNTLGERGVIRREDRATGKDEIALEMFLHWFLHRKPVIPIPFKRLGQ